MLDQTLREQLQTIASGIRESLETHVAALKSDSKMVEIIETQKNLNKLEEMLGLPKTGLAQIFGLEEASEKLESGAPSSAVELGEYYKIKPLEAAKRYLKKKGKAATLDEIVAGIRAGGCTVNPANLRKTLSRAVWQVAKVGPDAFGLVEFYPHIARNRRQNRADAEAASDAAEAGLIPAGEEEEEKEEE